MYAKVFASIFQGSLCTAGPWEALVTFQQMLILADKFGIVDMTAEAIARMTTVPLEIIQKGIVALEQPDPHSRNEALEGRRIKRIADHRTWGWEIVNYKYYNSIRTAEDRREYQRLYQQGYRQKRKQSVNKINKINQDNPSYKTQIKDICPNFQKFWKLYPRKEDKKKAEKIFKKLNPNPEELSFMLASLGVQKNSANWAKDNGKYIPLPTTWLNNSRWEDEVVQIEQEERTLQM